jgi:UDP-N-acetylglucosamine:LPS N-acetylglucosamine transferase
LHICAIRGTILVFDFDKLSGGKLVEHGCGDHAMKIGLVCSHGGHLTEMLQLLEAFEGHDLFFVTYRSGRVKELEQHHRVYALSNIGANPLRLVCSLPAAWRILRYERPDVLVSTGSEIAIPFFVLAQVLRIRAVFVESWCRVHSPSGTGKVVYPLADVFLVQWPQLLAAYGAKARYEGGLL